MLTCPPVKADKLKVFFPTRSSLVKEPNRHPGPDPSGSFLRSSLMNQPFARVNSFFRPVETFFDPLPDAPLGALSAAAKREPTRCPPPCQPLFFNFGDFFSEPPLPCHQTVTGSAARNTSLSLPRPSCQPLFTKKCDVQSFHGGFNQGSSLFYRNKASGLVDHNKAYGLLAHAEPAYELVVQARSSSTSLPREGLWRKIFRSRRQP